MQEKKKKKKDRGEEGADGVDGEKKKKSKVCVGFGAAPRAPLVSHHRPVALQKEKKDKGSDQ